MTEGRTQASWSAVAQTWLLGGAPLRPIQADLLLYQQAIDACTAPARRVLVLGATPELCSLHWPQGCQVFSLDSSLEMQKQLWPGPRETAVVGSWLNPPFSDADFDFIVCDAGLGIQTNFDVQVIMLKSIRRILRPTGLLVTRLFVPQAFSFTLDEIQARLNAGLFKNLEELKFAIWSALEVDGKVYPARVFRAIVEVSGGLERLKTLGRFPSEQVDALLIHEHNPGVYQKLTPEKLRQLAKAAEMKVDSEAIPDTPWGAGCPVLTLSRLD